MRMHIPVHEWSGVTWVVDGFGSEWIFFLSLTFAQNESYILFSCICTYIYILFLLEQNFVSLS